MNPLVSVIVPVYNTSAYLHRCLDSLCCQTYQHLEIICINDGSTDDSLEILQMYARKDPRIKVISTENHGLGAARNVGIEFANGVWISGLDSDDYWLPDTCEYVMTNVCDNVNVVQFGFITKREDKDEYILNPLRLNGIQSISVETTVVQHCEFWNKFWRKSFIDKFKCRFPEGLWYEDFFFYWAYLPLAKKVQYLPECKYVYVRRDTSIMGKSNKKDPKVLHHISILKFLLNYRTLNPLSNTYKALNLINFIQCWRFIEERVPDSCIDEADNMFEELSKHVLMKPWKKWLKHQEPQSSVMSLFIKYSVGKINFRLFGLTVLSFGIEADMIVWRLFGKRIYSQKLISWKVSERPES